MKTTVSVPVKKDVPAYPCIKVSADTGLVVLFDRPKHGMVLVETSFYKAGTYSGGWAEDQFEKFTGTVTLEN